MIKMVENGNQILHVFATTNMYKNALQNGARALKIGRYIPLTKLFELQMLLYEIYSTFYIKSLWKFEVRTGSVTGLH